MDNWDIQFAAPVQDAVIQVHVCVRSCMHPFQLLMLPILQVLQYWSYITGKRQLHAMPYRNLLLSWLKKFSEQRFWVGNRNKAVAEIWQKASKKAEQLEEVFYHQQFLCDR